MGGIALTYDSNANLTSDGAGSFTYDAENRLVQADVGGTVTDYQFDSRGRRKKKSDIGSGTIFVTGADNRELLEYDASNGTILRWYAYGPGANDLVGQMNVGPNTRAAFIPDMLGSVIGLQDAASGTITRFGYGIYGSSAAAPSNFGYTGQRNDPESGLYYYRARDYSTFLGRFNQPDPIGHEGGMHLYAYVENDPLNLLDPTGLETAKANGGFSLVSGVHVALTGASFCPSICGSAFSLLDAGVYAVQRDWTGAGISTAAAVAGAISDAGAIKVAAMGGVAAADALKTASAVTKYEVGTYDALKARSVIGDTLDIHHAMQAAPAETAVLGYSRTTAPAIALPKLEHTQIPVLSGAYGGTARDLLATDIRNLRNFTQAPNSALQQLIDLNKRMYPTSFAR